MDMNTYQKQTQTTKIYSAEYQTLYPAMGLANEAGEALGVVKKVLRDDAGFWTEEKKQKLASELGDVLYYLAATAADMGIELSTIAENNLAKLASRKERGVIGGSGDNR